MDTLSWPARVRGDGGRVALLGVHTGLRTRARGLPGSQGTGLDEDWTLVLTGVAVMVIIVGLAVLTAWTAHQRDAALQDARAAAHRLDIGGLDDRLYQDLIATQQDEVTLFQDRINVGQARAGHDPRTDLDRVESDLTALNGQFRDSPRVQRDITLISREMSRYTGLEAAAQADNQQGLPVGAAYLREASHYLHQLHAAQRQRHPEVRPGPDQSGRRGGGRAAVAAPRRWRTGPGLPGGRPDRDGTLHAAPAQPRTRRRHGSDPGHHRVVDHGPVDQPACGRQ